jgi:hypothetical protein
MYYHLGYKPLLDLEEGPVFVAGAARRDFVTLRSVSDWDVLKYVQFVRAPHI